MKNTYNIVKVLENPAFFGSIVRNRKLSKPFLKCILVARTWPLVTVWDEAPVFGHAHREHAAQRDVGRPDDRQAQHQEEQLLVTSEGAQVLQNPVQVHLLMRRRRRLGHDKIISIIYDRCKLGVIKLRRFMTVGQRSKLSKAHHMSSWKKCFEISSARERIFVKAVARRLAVRNLS